MRKKRSSSTELVIEETSTSSQPDQREKLKTLCMTLAQVNEQARAMHTRRLASGLAVADKNAVNSDDTVISRW